MATRPYQKDKMTYTLNSKFIVIEGLEGAGKSTAIAIVKNWLQSKGMSDIITTREPGGTPIAEKLRTLVKTVFEEEKLVSESELLLMYAARVQLVCNVIQPALSRGTWVIGDRHELSTRAYQGGGRGIAQSSLEMLYALCLKNFKPHLTLYLDISPSLGFERIQIRGHKDRIEQEDLSFFERVRAVYRSYVSEKDAIFEIDASQSMDKVHADIVTILEKHCL